MLRLFTSGGGGGGGGVVCGMWCVCVLQGDVLAALSLVAFTNHMLCQVLLILIIPLISLSITYLL